MSGCMAPVVDGFCLYGGGRTLGLLFGLAGTVPRNGLI